MRGAVCMVLLLLVPLASGLNTEFPVDPPVAETGERLLVLDEGVWTSDRWAMLEEQGIQPLRTVRHDALLVWMGDEAVSLDVGVSVGEHETAALREGLETPDGPGEYRVLLEPRLPADGVMNLRETLASLGFSIVEESLDVQGNLPASFTFFAPDVDALNPLLETEGVLWVEPVLTTRARNGQASALIEAGSMDGHPFWTMGLNGSGVIVGVADSGIDADHACFRNATSPTSAHAETNASHPAVGVFGDDHRKIILLNNSLDGNDTPGHSDYRHGTHVIGSLACHDVHSARQDAHPGNGSTLAHGTKLVVQDIVSSDGWVPPNVDALLWESSAHGGVIHSNSWGDDTTAYTERTGRFDAYARAVPWSLAVIAPGNSGEGVLEPANGRNVVAVSASTKSLDAERWGSTAYGPTEAGTDGIFVLAPGANILSAGADGFWNTNNENLRTSSGSSMATPHAAGAAAVVQQLYQDGWITHENDVLTNRYLSDIKPAWADPAPLFRGVELGEGFTPSGSLLRASLALATTPLPETVRNGGTGGHHLHNPYDGWGVLNLSQLMDPSAAAPGGDVWIHDSYRLVDQTVADWFSQHGGNTHDLSGVDGEAWSGQGSMGPFLRTGDMFTDRLTLVNGEDVRIRMAFPAQPEPAVVDDLQLRVRLQDGTILLPDRLRSGGFAPTEFYPEVVDTNNTTAFPSSNETVVGIDIPWSYLYGSSYIDVDVVARFVQPGGTQGAVGLDGDAVGFALAVKGVQRDSTGFDDDDGDGVFNTYDACPTEAAFPQHDADRDGCLDDGDDDGVPNLVDACPYEKALPQFDSDRDGCVDDDDGDGVSDDNDLCPEEAWEYMDDNGDGCDDANQWFIMVAPTALCHTTNPYLDSCAIAIRSIEVNVDGRTIYEQKDSVLTLGESWADEHWVHVFNKAEGADLENATQIELELEMMFWHGSVQTTQGRQWGWNDPCWPVGCYYDIHIPNWVVDVQLQKGMLEEHLHDERIVSISSFGYNSGNTYATHTFRWSNEIAIDDDGDGVTVPGTYYDGPCAGGGCSVTFNNVFDAFPNDATQWSDRDGDGYGDNASGYRGDLFPDDASEWADEDGDGYGSNSDACPDQYGTSRYEVGCPDLDGDGFADEYEICPGEYGTAFGWSERGCPDPDGDSYADNFSDVCPGVYGTADKAGVLGCPDTDMDGWADPGFAGVSPLHPNIDRCPDRYGTAFRGEYVGCRDTDMDGWPDVEDDLPNYGEYWIDSDGDGVADEEDLFAHNRLISHEGHVAALVFLGVLIALVAGLLFAKRHRAVEEAMAGELTAWLDGFRGPSTEQQNDEDESPAPYETKVF